MTFRPDPTLRALSALCLLAIAACIVAPPLIVWGAYERFGAEQAWFMAMLMLGFMGIPLLVLVEAAPRCFRCLLGRAQ